MTATTFSAGATGFAGAPCDPSAAPAASGRGASCVDDLLKLDNQLCFPLYACAKEVVRRYTPFLDELGLTYTQYLVMMVLWEKRSVSVSELGAALYLDSGTLTPLLKKMEAKNLLTRTRNERDERRVDVELSEAGAALKERAASVPLRMGDCVNIDPAEGAQLVSLLRKVLANVRASE